MLMTLALTVVGAPVLYLLGLLPTAPSPIDGLVLPLPSWVPVEPVLGSVAIVLAAGAAFLVLRAIRWVYSLIPVVQ